MIKKFNDKWFENKDKLKEYLETHKQEEYNSYLELLRLTLDIIVNDGGINQYYYGEDINTKDIKEIDFGNYQGTLIFIFSNNVYQPSVEQTYYTSVGYGSCSVCDTLLSISGYLDEELPTEKQVNDYMTLCLHLVENIHCFKEVD